MMRPLLAAVLLAAPAFAGQRAITAPRAQGAPAASALSGLALPAVSIPSLSAGLKLGSANADVEVPSAAVFDGQAARPALSLTPVSGAEAQAAGAPLAASTAQEGAASQAPAAVPPTPPAPPEPPTPSGWRAAVPSLITALNLTSGFAAILAASGGLFALSAGLILLANVFDGLDGRAARALGVSSDLGVELDSLADVVSFGAAPAALAWFAGLSALGPLGFAAAAVFAGAGAYRLARFNVGALAEKAGKVPPKPGDSFTGLPIPGGAGVLSAAVLTAPFLGSAAPAVLAAVALLTAAAMVSRLPYPAFKKGGLRALALPGLIAAVVSGGLLAAGAPILIPAAVFGLFLLAGPAAWLWSGGSESFRREAKRKLFHQVTLITVPLYLLTPPDWRLATAAGFTAFIGLVELARLKSATLRPFFEKWFGGIIRAKESARFSGSFYAALGATVVVLLFGSDAPACLAGFLALGLADAASPLVGLRFGWKPFTVAGTQRSVDGALAGFAVAAAIALALGFSLPVALAAALAFSAVDIYPVKPDDNFWIPVVFAAALHLLG